jgi:hypothetical protein
VHVDHFAQQIWKSLKYCENSRQIFRDFITPIEIEQNEQGRQYAFIYTNALGNKIEFSVLDGKKKTSIK